MKYKKEHNSGKIVEKSSLLNLDVRTIHLHTTPSFNLSFRSQAIIWKPTI